MSGESDRRETLKRATRRRATREAAPAAAPVVRAKPIRITVDLAPELYATLTRLTNQTALDAGRKLTQSDLIRALVTAADNQPLILELARQQLAPNPVQRHVDTSSSPTRARSARPDQPGRSTRS